MEFIHVLIFVPFASNVYVNFESSILFVNFCRPSAPYETI
jgi:hypothetical protein